VTFTGATPPIVFIQAGLHRSRGCSIPRSGEASASPRDSESSSLAALFQPSRTKTLKRDGHTTTDAANGSKAGNLPAITRIALLNSAKLGP